MKKSLESAFENFAPSAEELWQRGGARMHSVEIELGRREEIPFFNLELASRKELNCDKLEIYNGRRSQEIGREVLLQITLSDGIDRLARVTQLNDNERFEDNFIVTDGTAWTTTINGYAHDRATQIASQNRVNTIQVGAEHSGRNIPYGLDGLRLGRTLHQARSISLAKTAQSEQLIISQLVQDYDLAAAQYAIGDSRASMATPGHFPYAKLYGNKIIYMDTKAPCVPEKLTGCDIGRLARWLGVEALVATQVITKLATEGRLNTLAGTMSANPNSALSSMLGVAPALVSGEAGRMVSWVPQGTPGHIVVYGKDGLSQADKWREIWQQHPNVYLKSVERKGHVHILESKAHQRQIGRIGRFSEELNYAGGNLEQIDWLNVIQQPLHPTSVDMDVA